MAPARFSMVAFLLAAFAVAACTNTSTSTLSGSPPKLGGQQQLKFKHVVFIIQENRTFDNIFGGANPFPGAEAAVAGAVPSGTPIPLASIPLECTYSILVYKCSRQDPDNYHAQWLTACNPPSPPPFAVGGPSPCRMNGFSANQTGDLDPGQIYSYVDRTESKPYWDIARAYALGDHFFMGHNSESYTADQYIFSAQSNNVVDGPVFPLPTPAAQKYFITPWGCDSPPGTATFTLDPTTGQESAKPSGGLPCFSYPALASLVDASPAKLSWRLYAYSICQNINALDVNQSIRNSSAWPDAIEKTCPNAAAVNTTNFRAPEDSFLTDVSGKSGTLASVTWILPGAITSDHPGVPYGYCGPWWVASIVDAIGKSQFWDSTVVFIFWDDWGGFYDHVAPYVVRDQAGPGFRVPFMVVSPYARRGVVVKTDAEFATLAQFVESNFDLGSLHATDTSPYANNLDDFFDFSTPKPFVPISIPSFVACNDTLSRPRPPASSSRWLRMIGAPSGAHAALTSKTKRSVSGPSV